MNQSAFGAIEAWSRLRHPNIVSVHEAFTTRAFNDSCKFSISGNLHAVFSRVSQPSWSYMTTIRTPRHYTKLISSPRRRSSRMAGFKHSPTASQNVQSGRMSSRSRTPSRPSTTLGSLCASSTQQRSSSPGRIGKFPPCLHLHAWRRFSLHWTGSGSGRVGSSTC